MRDPLFSFLALAAFGFLGSGITFARAGRDLATARIVFHGVAGFLWLSFFVVQTQLVLRGWVSLHRALGKVGVALFAFLVLATVNLLLTARPQHIRRSPSTACLPRGRPV